MRVGDIFGEIKNKLTGGAGTAAAAGLANGLLYAFFHQFLPDGTPEPQSTDNFLRQAGVPDIVRQKAWYANQTLEYMHKHWGVSYHDMADVSDTNSAIRLALKQALGMEPRDYLAKIVPLPSNAPRISGVGLAISDIETSLSNILPSSIKSSTVTNLAQTALVSNPVTAVPASAALAAKQVLQQVLGSLITFKSPPDTWQMAYPLPQDWNGYKSLTPVGIYKPSINDPLGITGFNGVAFGQAERMDISEAGGSSVLPAGSTQAGLGDKIGVFLLLGAVGVLGYLWSKGKIK